MARADDLKLLQSQVEEARNLLSIETANLFRERKKANDLATLIADQQKQICALELEKAALHRRLHAAEAEIVSLRGEHQQQSAQRLPSKVKVAPHIIDNDNNDDNSKQAAAARRCVHTEMARLESKLRQSHPFAESLDLQLSHLLGVDGYEHLSVEQMSTLQHIHASCLNDLRFAIETAMLRLKVDLIEERNNLKSELERLQLRDPTHGESSKFSRNK